MNTGTDETSSRTCKGAGAFRLSAKPGRYWRGCLSPLIAWKGENILLDGHNRYKYCIAHDIPFKVEKIFCVNRELAMDWMRLHQLGRRNLTPDQASFLRADLYESRKKSVGAPEGNVNNNPESQWAQNEPITGRTADRVAKETGVSRETVKRDAVFAKAADELGIRDQIMSGELKVTKKDVIAEAKAASLPRHQ